MSLWQPEESAAYQQRQSPILDLLYTRAVTPAQKPWQRAEYLLQGILAVTMADHEVFMERAKEQGRASVLGELEDLAIRELEGKKDPFLHIVQNGGYAQVTLPHPKYSGENGLYRLYGPTKTIEGLCIPDHITAKCMDESWKPFPIRFKRRAGMIPNFFRDTWYIFLANGTFRTCENNHRTRRDYDRISREGNKDSVRIFSRT